jgi:hypothetical protein
MAIIPYVSQPKGSMKCAAAALEMVYRSYGRAEDLESIWPRIAYPDGSGGLYGRTAKVALDALHHGFAAVVVHARDPVKVLQVAQAEDVRVLLIHRPGLYSKLGHMTVLTGLTETGVTVHDPELGPDRAMTLPHLLALWRPIKGGQTKRYALVAIAPWTISSVACPVCAAVIPPQPVINCQSCGEPYPLMPSAILGCLNDSCAGRLWDDVTCPQPGCHHR